MRRFLHFFIVLLCCFACARPPTLKQAPPAGDYFRSLTIAFSFSDGDGKQSGRMHWRFNASRSKLLFFTPLNQVGLELNVEGEEALLLRPAKQLYWRGRFNDLIDRLWGIDFSLDEMKRLIADGELPEAKIREQGIEMRVEKDAVHGAPRLVHIRRRRSDLTLKIRRSEFRSGAIVFLDYRTKFSEADLEDILSDD